MNPNLFNAHMTRMNETPITCPGLVHEPGGPEWYVPDDYSVAERTYCRGCVQKYNIPNCKPIRSMGNYSCEGYLHDKGIDNGIINISLWSTDQRKHYPVVNGVVKIPSGIFHVHVYHDITRFRSAVRPFTATLVLNGRKVVTSPVTRSSYIFTGFKFINSDHPVNSVLQRVGSQGKVTSDCKLEVNILFHELTKVDHMTLSGQDLGRFTYNGEHLGSTERIAKIYAHPNMEYQDLPVGVKVVPFSKVPMVLGCNIESLPLLEDTDVAYSASSVARELLASKINIDPADHHTLVEASRHPVAPQTSVGATVVEGVILNGFNNEIISALLSVNTVLQMPWQSQ